MRNENQINRNKIKIAPLAGNSIFSII